MSSSSKRLIIEGARQNNLKNISLQLPHDNVIAVTGVSGSGKSSLAFETLFAEGQWRFIESLSTYARLFLEKMDRPDADAIHNIRPAIALEQRNPVRGSRSTVGTLTEIYDYLKLLYSKVSTPFCPECGVEIRKWDSSSAASDLAEKHSGEKAMIVFRTDMPVDEIKRKGYRRVLVDGEATDIDGIRENDKNGTLFMDVVLDRLVISEGSRLSDSIETAFREGKGAIKAIIVEGPIVVYTSSNSCDRCGLELPTPSPILFSFNHPIGACRECKGFGNVLKYAEELVIPDEFLSLSQGAVEPWEKPAYRWWKRQMMAALKKAGIDVNKPYRELSVEQRRMVFRGGEGFYGVNDFFEELEGKRYKLHVRVFLSRYRKGVVCPVCRGKRLRREALSYKISGLDIAELSSMQLSEMSDLFGDIGLSSFEKDIAKEILRQIDMKLGFLSRVGLDYLTLSREGRTLSGGEYQRVNLSSQLASRLTGTLYVLDEPTVGLHARDTDRVSQIMNELSRMGNTVVVVEHDKSVISSADWIVELGPEGGSGGGNVVFSGEKSDFLNSDTLTARYVTGKERIGYTGGKKIRGDFLRLIGAAGNNLKDVNLDLPSNAFTVVTGVSGSGKSSLVVDTLYKALARKFPLPYKDIKGKANLKGVKLIDQSPIGKSPRSNPVTYLKIFDHIRRLFAETVESKAHGYGPGFFSFNVPGGRCRTCKGEGYQKVEMYFFEDLYIKCEDCNGKRYGLEALGVKYRGMSIYDVLNLTVEEADDVFADQPRMLDKLSLMGDVGLGYLRLGQPSTTLSGGEAQRLKICAELGAGRVHDVLYIMDEPTVGLHPRDVAALLGVIERLIDAGNTVVVIEHNLDVIKAADWIVDMGPEGGDGGGRIIFSGPPGDIISAKDSYTGKYLKESL